MQASDIKANKFSTTATLQYPILKGSVKEFLHAKYDNSCSFGIDNLMRNGVFQLSGWIFDFKPHLKRYLYRQYEQWVEVYAPNKTLLRSAVCGGIDEIVEIPQRKSWA